MSISYPTFVDGNVLSASQLNQLGDAVRTLRSAIETAGMAFVTVSVSNVGGTLSFWLRHANRYLVFRATGDVNEYDVTVSPEGGTPVLVLNNAGTLDRIASGDWIDLQTHVPLLTAGQFYRVDVTIVDPSTCTLSVFMLYERSAA
jgi:hypothetical protein